MNRAHAPALLFSVAAMALLAVAAFSFPYAPLEDFPEWIYQGHVFNKLVEGQSSLLYEVKTYPVPYALLQLMVSALLLVAAPMMASRIVLALWGVLSLVAVHKVIARNAVSPWIGWPLLLSLIVFNSPFWNGYLGYQSGLLVLLFFLALPRDNRSDWRWVLAFSLLAFFAHGWGDVALLAFIGAYALYDRRIVSCGAALAPSLLLLAIYRKFNVSHSELTVMFDLDHVNPVLYKLYTLLKSGPYHNAIVFDFNAMAHFGPAFLGAGLALDAIFFLALGALALMALRALGWREFGARPETLTGVGLVALALILPPTGFEMANPGERILIPGLLALSLAFFSGYSPSALVPRVALSGAVLGGMALFALGLIAGGAAYRSGTAGAEAMAAKQTETGARYSWFGHRLVQFDSRMREAEKAWRHDALPSEPLAFETGLIANRR